MSITDELREWAREQRTGNVLTCYPPKHEIRGVEEDVLAIADCVDAEHDELLKNAYECSASDEFLEGHGWVKLPVDADGAPIHVGDVVTMQLLFGGESKPLVVDRMELSHGRDGDLWCIALDTDKECWNQPSLMRHYTPPTVEDVLTEFSCVLMGKREFDGDVMDVIAEYAAKLRLAGEDE